MYELIRKISLPFLLRLIGAILTYVSTILVVNYYGVEGSGDFFSILALWVIIYGVGKFGMDTISLRYISAAETSEKPGLSGYFLKKSIVNLSIYMFFLITLGFFLEEGFIDLDAKFQSVWWAAVWASPSTILIFIMASCIQGRGQISLATLSNGVLISSFFVLLLWIFSPEIWHGDLYIIANLLALSVVVTIFLTKKEFWKIDFKLNMAERYINRSSLRLTISTMLTLLNVWLGQLVVFAYFLDYEKTLFGIGDRTSKLFMILLMAINAVMAPMISRMWASGDYILLVKILKKIVLSMSCVGLVAMFVVINSADSILWIFGISNPLASQILIILCIGQLVNLATGPSVFMLTMTGNESLLLYTQIIVLSVFSLMLYFSVQIGLLAVAISQSFTIAAYNICCFCIGIRLMNNKVSNV